MVGSGKIRSDPASDLLTWDGIRGATFTFADLKAKNISSQQLLQWSAPVDTAERYQIFLDSVSNSYSAFENGTLFYNCTPPWFGPYCRFTFYQSANTSSNDMIKALLIAFSVLVKSVGVTCYEHLKCQISFSCLSWHNICDRKVDCLDGSDEMDCWQLEINECNENEYRCHNGQCIPQEFFHDIPLNPDCLDQTDEPMRLDFQANCQHDPAFRCEEHTCRPGVYDFPCGDRECTSETYSCRNGRDKILPDDYCSNAAACSINLSQMNETWCEEFCTNINCIEKYCGSLYEIHTGPGLLGHVHFLFTNEEVLFESETKFLPDYVCYDEKLCIDFLPGKVSLNGSTCRHRDELQLDTPHVYLEFLIQVKRLFRGCLVMANNTHYCNHPSMYQCEKTSKCISKHRLIDGIQDCPFNDDETFNQSCSLNNTHYRFPCSVDKTKMCISPLLIEDNKNDCDNEEDEYPTKVILSENQINFQTICDNNEQLLPILIDEQYETDETSCDFWECNNTYTRCDKFWHCKDGADEVNCSPSTCPEFQHSCVFPNDTSKISCLPINLAGDDIAHCLGATDERSGCVNFSPEYYEYKFGCQNPKLCIYSALLCNNKSDCLLHDDEIFCANPPDDEFDSLCFFYPSDSRTEVENFLCEFGDQQRRPKSLYFILSDMPIEYQEMSPSAVLSQSIAQTRIESNEIHSIKTNRNNNSGSCNRGIPVMVWMGEETNTFYCLCPQSYYGDLCQYQNQRVSLTVQIRVTMDWRSLLTFLILLIDDEMNTESHDIIEYFPIRDCDTKFNIYLLYSTRPKDISKNYSIRIDAFTHGKIFE
ncbi:unnamed protein product [Adineta ricciae]|uniref:EGF-like domain-containing protein n=1 Tax=Adineta ricciae TaxID=249248 RepID=A0A815ZEI7_ADIRI|nr:unnamed protein product [Adineta ricciae]CAF1581255.1 unnamed protein product [Adineta ricciae]